ncbi:MAG: FHA domain-containing protein [Pirellulales bacterium]
MEAKLLVLAPAEIANTEFALALPVTLGRGRDAKLKVVHGQISRLHCELYEADGKLMAKDLGSLNGTFVNNERITETVLPPGGLLNVGSVVFRAVYGVMPEEGNDDSTVDFGPRVHDTVTNTSTVFGGAMPDFGQAGTAHGEAPHAHESAEEVDFSMFSEDDESAPKPATPAAQTPPTPAPAKPAAAPPPVPAPAAPAAKTPAPPAPASPAAPAPAGGPNFDDVDGWLTEDTDHAELPADDEDLQSFFKKT